MVNSTPSDCAGVLVTGTNYSFELAFERIPDEANKPDKRNE